MEHKWIILLLAVAIPSFIALAIAGYIREKRRREALQALALQLGLHFMPQKNRNIPHEYAFINFLRQGDDRYAYNIMEGDYKGHSVLLFDYHYSTTTKDSKGHRSTHHHYCNLMLLHLERSFPELCIYPENFLSKIGQMLGYEDIDFESIEFSKAFTVRSKNRKFAYDICHARMMEYLLKRRDISVEIEQNGLALSDMNRLNPEKIVERLNWLCELRALFPKYLFTEIN